MAHVTYTRCGNGLKLGLYRAGSGANADFTFVVLSYSPSP